MLKLASKTDPAWVERVERNLPELLLDHAHCEKKAASTAVSLIFRYPEFTEMIRPLSEIAREELEHFELMLDLLESRGENFSEAQPPPRMLESSYLDCAQPTPRNSSTRFCAARSSKQEVVNA